MGESAKVNTLVECETKMLNNDEEKKDKLYNIQESN